MTCKPLNERQNQPSKLIPDSGRSTSLKGSASKRAMTCKMADQVLLVCPLQHLRDVSPTLISPPLSSRDNGDR